MRAVAAELFLAHGYDGVSLDEIVRVAGGSKTNVYGFFGGKEGLFLAVAEEVCRDLLAPLRELDLDGLALEEGLARLARTLLDLLLEPCHLAFFRLVTGESRRFPEAARIWHENGPAASRAIIAGFLDAHRADPRLPPALAVEDAAALFHDMIAGGLVHRALVGCPVAPQERDRAVAGAVAMLLRG